MQARDLTVWTAVETLDGLCADAGANSGQSHVHWLPDAYTRNRTNVASTAEKMRPGAQQEVRTFGQQVGPVDSQLWPQSTEAW